MKCPYCSYAETKVIDSRPIEDNTAIRRRRECMRCQKRFTTYEKIEDMPVMVIKKDGSRQPFDKTKILAGILKACEKRPVSIDVLRNFVDDIEKQVYGSVDKEITSSQIGEIVMEKLIRLDQVAYVRFASVYKDFKDVHSFMNELKKLMDKWEGETFDAAKNTCG